MSPPSAPSLEAPALATGMGCPSQVRDALATGSLLELDARWSNSGGVAAVAAVINNLRTLAATLARNDVFPNVPDLLPSETELKRRFRDEATTVKSRDREGNEFEHRFLNFRVPGTPVYLHLACGTGLKVDHESGHQPAALHAANVIERIKPVAICANEVARWSRNPWSLHPWVEALFDLESTFGHPAYLSFDGDPPEPFTSAAAFRLFERSNQAGFEARDMKNRTTKAVRGMLPLPDLGGYCYYPFSQAPPPPLAIAWMRDDTAGIRGRQIVFIDTPAVRQALEGLISYGMPEVFTADGTTPVDQLALVRLYLKHRGLPDWPRSRLIDHLVRSGYSTQGVRRQHKSPRRDWRGRTLTKSQLQRLIDGIEKHLDFYKDGTLIRRVGDRGPAVPAFTLLPPDGQPYMAQADHDRIVGFRSERTEEANRARHYTFGHHPVVANGCPGLLIPKRSDNGCVTYRVRRRSDQTASHRSRDRGDDARPAPTIPSRQFAQSLVDALADHGSALAAFVREPNPRQSDASELLARLTGLHSHKKKETSRIRAMLKADGDAAFTGQLRKDINDDYNTLCTEVDTLAHAIVEARAALEREIRRHDPRSIAVDRLLDVIKSLRDPEDTTFHDEWRHTVHRLDIETDYVIEHGMRLARTTWSGQLLIHDGDDERIIPFADSFSMPMKQQVTTTALIEDLRRGDRTRLDTTYWQNAEGRNRLSEALGIERGQPAPALTIRDPRLLTIAMAAAYPPKAGHGIGAPLTARQLPALARRLNEPLDLVKRVVAVTPAQGRAAGCTRKWQTDGDRAVEAVCRAAARRGGRLSIRDFDGRTWENMRHAAKRVGPTMFQFARGEIQMLPCACGSYRRGFLNIREATEPVCWSCRRDVTGIEWPSFYDRYRTKMMP